MFSVSPAEILTIAVVALLVFGPRRLPEIARKAGKLLRELRDVTNDLKSGLEAEYQEVLEPLKDVRETMQDAITAVDPDPAAEPKPETEMEPEPAEAEADPEDDPDPAPSTGDPA